jgi:hypothetical protein
MATKESKDEALINAFIKFFMQFGMTEEAAKKLLEGVSADDLRNSPEIRKIITEDVEQTKRRQEEERAKAEREKRKLELIKKLEALKPQLDATEAERKKLMEQRDEILRNLT